MTSASRSTARTPQLTSEDLRTDMGVEGAEREELIAAIDLLHKKLVVAREAELDQQRTTSALRLLQVGMPGVGGVYMYANALTVTV